MRRICIRFSRPSLKSSFVAETLKKHPDSCFSDILFHWQRQGLTPISSSTNTQDGMSNDDDHIQGYYDPAEVQLLNKLSDYPFTDCARHLLRHHTVAHFAAQLGRIDLMDLLFSEGVVLQVDNTDKDEESGIEKNQYRRVSLENVALSISNDEGYLISHLAAQHGYLNFLKDLVRRFGADAILSQRTVGKSLQFGRVSLTPYQLSFMYGWIPILEWIDTLYPMYSFDSTEEALFCVKRASLHDHINSLRYFLQRHGEDSHAILRDGLYPAAEAGAVDVLNFLVETIGDHIVWSTCEVGATALHHAARRGCTHLLEDFFIKYDLQKHVDDRDNDGRTPAMWCIMGGKHQRNIEFLHSLLELGSQWPLDVDNEGRDMDVFVRYYCAPTARMRKYVGRCVALWQQRRREMKRDDDNTNNDT
ncbi:uncharacterized protein TM35_000022170 [Trypanosoma theileri]|uniref:Uncharacterized protein n=1 Tax=Trypanosoma theileri TaxID=67003 RepID=A0A1X0P7T1_9TRYP|nr:uncharacterized protein TM35_000022170 [Trypanosoma theileri]ORC92891.1 hypothetical protein TM35_000022170 [Trypanosoma theileri]